MVTEEEKRRFLQNEEKLWDLAAITIASALVSKIGRDSEARQEEVANLSYAYADTLMRERRKKLNESST